ncbi:MAG: hypothetical protein J6Z43_03070 [Clostridiales bacterium]|nr:hypothetical protein [Clostridiales bacterium]
MDKAYLIKQLKELSDASGLSISEDIIARTGNPAASAGLVLSGVVRSYYVDGDYNDVTQYFAAEGNLCADSGMVDPNECG